MTKLYIDLGHGGSDSGAVGSGLKEKDIVLKIGMKIREMLAEYKVDFRFSRTTDKTLSLKNRTDDANMWGADFLLSIHINATVGGYGYEDFIHDELSATSNTSKIRTIIHNEIISVVDFKNRGKKKANYHMLRESNMSAMLTENGFIDHAEDAKKLKSDAYLTKIAQGHVNGLVKAFDLKKKDVVKVNYIKHVVIHGETLYRIATIYKTTINDILKLNPNIKNPNQIYVGNVITIPKK